MLPSPSTTKASSGAANFIRTMKTIASLLVALCAFAFAACGTLEKTGPYQGDDVLYRADVTITTSYQALHGFVTWEYENRAALAGQPQIRHAADQVRQNAEKWTNSAIALREAYAANPTPETKASLVKALGVLQAAMSEATKYLTLPPAQPAKS